ncbi:MAG: STAS domain-containing protein [Gammaproteobacteria bacterium]
MAKKGDKSLIGFNPLAWMDDKSEKLADAENVENKTAAQKVNDDSIKEISSKKPEVQIDAEPEETAKKELKAAKIVLDATLNIQIVDDLCEQLKILLENNNHLEIDASAVAVIDTSILQLLLVVKQTAIKLNKVVSIDFPSDKFIEASDLLGVSEVLDVNHAVAGFF